MNKNNKINDSTLELVHMLAFKYVNKHDEKWSWQWHWASQRFTLQTSSTDLLDNQKQVFNAIVNCQPVLYKC